MKVLWRSVALITSLFTQAFVAGGEVTVGLGSQTIEFAAYLSSEIMQVACKWLVIFIAT